MSSFLVLFRVLGYLDKKSKIKLIFNFFLSILSSLLEALSLSSALLFFSLLFTGEIFNNQFINNFFPFFAEISTNSMTIIFVIFFSLSGILRIYILRNTFFLTAYLANKLSSLAFSKLINQNYSFHLSGNSSFQISTLTYDVGVAVNAISCLLQSSSAIVSLISLSITIAIFINLYFIGILISIIIVYLILYLFYSKKFRKNSKLMSHLSGKLLDFCKDSLLSIRNIIISQEQDFYIETFKNNDKKFRLSQAINDFNVSYPRTLIEILLILIISVLFIIFPSLTNPKSFAVFATSLLALQRLFPIFQLIYNSTSAIQGAKTGLSNLLILLQLNFSKKSFNKNNNFKFESIKLLNIYYAYPKSKKNALNTFSSEFNEGDKVGIYGPSGSGKTTYVDIVMLLLNPTKGSIFINNKLLKSSNKSYFKKYYQDSISHVSQNIYLIDSDILSNIVGPFTKNVDNERLRLALRISLLEDLVNSLPNKIHSKVGENGCLLSGGQRQRIIIAREIYKMKPILVLDEATNSLDIRTEKKILKQIFELKHIKILFLITHNQTNLNLCNKRINIKDGSIMNQSL
tara:strand:+ start:2369 stop:4087 length:1719 start_codon:yes stop_codon:yes gene_type:complete